MEKRRPRRCRRAPCDFDHVSATGAARTLVSTQRPVAEHGQGTIVLGVFAGDPHALPSVLLSDLLSDRRFPVIDLGANTPTDSFVSVAQSCDDLVGVGAGVALDALIPQALAQASEIRAALPKACLVVGAPAAAARRVGFEQVVDTVSQDAGHACDAFEQAALDTASDMSLSESSQSDGRLRCLRATRFTDSRGI